MSVPLTVLIPTHGRPQLLERTLDSLSQCTLPESYEELVVIENGSQAGAEERVRELPEPLNARYMHRERGNKSYALNEALDTITDGLVVFFDDDVRVHSETLVAYAEAAGSHEGRAIFGGPTGVDYEKEPPEWLLPYLPGSASGWGQDGFEQEDYQWFLGFNWAAFREDIVSQGGFDLRFGPGSPTGATGQETDLQKRMVGSGLEKQFVPRAKVWHYVPKSKSTPLWVLGRRYRQGHEKGLRIKRGKVSMLGLPGLFYRIGCVIPYNIVYSLVNIERPNVYKEIAELCANFGFVAGYTKRVKTKDKL